MNTKQMLKFACEEWGNDNSPIAKRNLAVAECLAICGSSANVVDLRWDQIHFGNKPFMYYQSFANTLDRLVNRGRSTMPPSTVQLPQSCVDALNAWLECVWDLYSQTTLTMRWYVFKSKLIADALETDVERQIHQLSLDANGVFDIEHILERRYREIALAKEALRREEKAKQEQVKADYLESIRQKQISKSNQTVHYGFKASKAVEQLFKPNRLSDKPKDRKTLVSNPVAEQRLKERQSEDAAFEKQYLYDTLIEYIAPIFRDYRQSNSYRKRMYYDPSSTYFDFDANRH